MGFGGEVKVTVFVDTTVVSFGAVIDNCVYVSCDLEVIIVIPINFILVDDTIGAKCPVYYI